MTRLRVMSTAAGAVIAYIGARWLYENGSRLAAERMSAGLAAIVPLAIYAVLVIVLVRGAAPAAGVERPSARAEGRRPARDVIAGALLGMAMVVAVLAVGVAAGAVRFETSPLPFGALARAAGGAAVIFAGIAAAEEVTFRVVGVGLLQGAVGVPAAVGLSSLAFAAAHIGGGGALYLTGVFCLGLLLGVAYLRAGTVWMPLGIHWGWDWLQSTASLLDGHGLNRVAVAHPLFGALDQLEASWVSIAICVALAAALVALLRRTHRRDHAPVGFHSVPVGPAWFPFTDRASRRRVER